MSVPITAKTIAITANGYDESAFADSYWLEPNVDGLRRIDRSADSLIRYARKLVELGAIPENPSVLDVGAGPGMVVHQFRRAGFRCEGCEFSESGRRLAKSEFDIELLDCDLRATLPYNDGEFDFVMCVGVLTMIPRCSMSNAMNEIRRICKGVAHLHLINPSNAPNEPHLTSLPFLGWLVMATNAGLVDVTSLWPPQREGIGMFDEFSGIFMTR